MAVPVLVAGLVIPSAYAKGPGPKPVKVVCTTLSGNIANVPTPPTISGCSMPTATGGSGTFSGFTGQTGTLTITWNGTGTTSAAYSATIPQSNGNKCPAGQTEAILHGSVTGNSPTGTGNAGVKGALHSKICLDSGGNLSLLHGQTFKV
jgi:hypothetical protein